MQTATNASTPSYVPPARHAGPASYQKVGPILMFFAIILMGVGGALLSYCVPDSDGFCYYPDAGAGWGLIGLGVIVLVVAIVLTFTARRPTPVEVPVGAGSPPPLEFLPATTPPPIFPTPPVPAPPPPPPPVGQYCVVCGRPVTYIPQYGRYYCFPCARYAV